MSMEGLATIITVISNESCLLETKVIKTQNHKNDSDFLKVYLDNCILVLSSVAHIHWNDTEKTSMAPA